MALLGTLNWPEALKRSLLYNDFKSQIDNLFRGIDRSANHSTNTYSIKALIFSLNHLSFLHKLQKKNLGISSSVPAIISFFYSIENAAKSMILAQNGSCPSNHKGIANAWQSLADQNLVIDPFSFSITDLTTNSVEQKLLRLRNGNTHNLNKILPDPEWSKGAIFSYLSGTCEFSRWEIEEQIKSKNAQYRALEVSGFRKAEARIIRDNILSTKSVNFMTQVTRFREKANYRDCLFFSYKIGQESKYDTLIENLFFVASSFTDMALLFLKKRLNVSLFQDFTNEFVSQNSLQIHSLDFDRERWTPQSNA